MKTLTTLTLRQTLLIILLIISPLAKAQLAVDISPPSGCAPLDVTFTNNTAGEDSIVFDFFGVIPGWTWINPGATDTTVTFPNPGNVSYFIQAYQSFQFKTGTITITGVSDSLTISKDTVCPGDIIYFDSPTNGLSYEWHFGDGDSMIGKFANHEYASLGNYTVSLYINTASCGWDTISKPIAVVNTIKPELGAFTVLDSIVCIGQDVTFDLPSFADYQAISWQFGDGDSSNTLQRTSTHPYLALGSYVVDLYVTNGCLQKDTGNAIVHVVDTISAATAIASVSDTIVCKNDNISFWVNNFNDYSALDWNYGDGNNGTDLAAENVHAYTTLGSYPVRLFAYNNCGKSDTVDFVVHVVDTISPTIGTWSISSNLVCVGETVTYTLNDITPYDDFLWQYGDGYVGDIYNTTNTHQYNIPGVFTVKLIVYNNCGNASSVTTTITVSDNLIPRADPLVIDTPACPGELVSFTQPNFSAAYTSMLWDFGDGNTSTLLEGSVSHSYVLPGVYNVSCIVVNGCGNSDTAFSAITIGGSVRPDVGIGHSVSPNPVCPNQEVDFTFNNFASFYDFTWYYGDGDSGTNYGVLNTHEYTSPGLFNALLVVKNSCGNKDTATYPISIIPILQADINFMLLETDTACQNQTLGFFLTNHAEFDSVHWDFGDGNTSDSLDFRLTHNYAALGQYIVTLIGYNGCGNSDTESLTIDILNNVPPVQASTSISETLACPNQEIIFECSNYWQYSAITWFFGNGDSGTVLTDRNYYSYPGTGINNVSLVVTSHCGLKDTFGVGTITITNAISPTLGNHYIVDDAICAGEQVIAIVDNVADYDTMFWSFGDGNFGTVQSDTNYNTYVGQGNYTATVTVFNSCGNADVGFVPVKVSGSPTAFAGADRNICAGAPVSIGGSPTATGGLAPYYYQWSPATGLDDNTAANPNAGPTTNTSYTVLVLDSNACEDTDFMNITVDPAPTADAGRDTTVFPGTVVSLGGTPSGSGGTPGYTYDWSPGMNMNDSTVANPTVSISGVNTTTYSLGLSDSKTCMDLDDVTITFDCPLPIAKFGCTSEGLKVTCIDSSENVDQWTWTTGDGGVFFDTNLVHTYLNPGTYTIKLEVVINACNYFEDDSIDMTVPTGIKDLSKANINKLKIYPNPSTADFTVSYELTGTQQVELIMQSIVGDEVKVLLDQAQSKGKHQLKVDPDAFGLSSGIYIIRLKTPDETASKRFVRIR